MPSTRPFAKPTESSVRTSSKSSHDLQGTRSSRAELSSESVDIISRPRTRPRTAVSTLGGSGIQQIVCAITESRGISPTVGLAFVNLSTTEAVLCQIADNQTYVRTLHKLHVLEPSEILVPNTTVTPVKSKLLQILDTNLDFDPSITPISRGYWDEASGNHYIQQLAFKDDVEAIMVSVGGSYFATCCLAAASKDSLDQGNG